MPPQQLMQKFCHVRPHQGENKRGLGTLRQAGGGTCVTTEGRGSLGWAEQGHGSGWAQELKKCPLELFCSCSQPLKVFQMPLNQ